MPPLNYDILKEICVQASIDQEEIPWNFVLASSQNLKIFHDLIKNVRKIEFKIYGIKAIFVSFFYIILKVFITYFSGLGCILFEI